ncbi:MAG: type II toxin-antitoxin system RelE/ParE family toxin [Cyanobacteria bacterium J06634_6]
MAYKVRVLPQALQDVETIFRWLSIDSPATAQKWFQGIQNTLTKLEDMPARFPRAPESDVLGVEIRQLVYQRRYRILFTISASIVRIHHIRHSARQWMTEDEFKL